MAGHDSSIVRCDVVLEQTLGHVTHAQNLRRHLSGRSDLEPTFVAVEFHVDGWRRRIPGYGNWTVRAAIRARRGLAALGPDHRPDAMFVHTQVPAVLLGRRMVTTPTVVSLDATPKQYDELGEHYGHATGSVPVERVKAWMHRRCFERAAHLVTWADWTKRGLVDDYGVVPDRVTVIPPGVDTARWLRADEPRGDGEGPVRILFVGGDLDRKGGRDLLRAFAPLRAHLGPRIELHLVTRSEPPAADGVTVHSMEPNSAELIGLYHRSHIFCLPTRGDCLPMVLPEAGAAGLALVSTDVGAIREIVRDGETGLLVPVAAPDALREALRRLVDDPQLRLRLAAGATALVRAEHDAAANAARLVELIRTVARTPVP